MSAYEDCADKKIEELWDEIEALKRNMLECSFRLGALSMATEGHLRAQICKADNLLLKSLGKELHLVAGTWQENDPDYRRLIGDVETTVGKG